MRASCLCCVLRVAGSVCSPMGVVPEMQTNYPTFFHIAIVILDAAKGAQRIWLRASCWEPRCSCVSPDDR